MKDVKALAKLLVKEDRKMGTAHRKHHKFRARVLQRAMSLDDKYMAAMTSLYRTLDAKAIQTAARRLIGDMQDFMDKRLGRVKQNPVPRRERRFNARQKLKGV